MSTDTVHVGRGSAAPITKRRLLHGTGLAIVVLFIVALQYALNARSDLDTALARLTDAQGQQRDAVALQESWNTWRDHQQAMSGLADAIDSTRLSVNDWRQRGLTVESARMSREQAQAYMSSLAHSDDYFFVPQRFEISVLQETDDLLRWRVGSTDELELTLVGTYFIRSQP